MSGAAFAIALGSSAVGACVASFAVSPRGLTLLMRAAIVTGAAGTTVLAWVCIATISMALHG